MTPARWRQIEDLYNAVCNTQPDGRAALLARADPDVRLAVEKMLDQPGTGSPLDRPAWEETTDSAPLQPSPGAQLGPYRIEGSLGAGGMGEVFKATDSRLHRTVAIKILSRDKVADPERKRRFLQEARAASALCHPNIVTLYDIASEQESTTW